MKKVIGWLLVLAVIAGLCVWQIPGLYRDLSFYWTEHTEAELQVKEYADANGLRYSDYPESLIRLLERNPETEKFVLEYPLRDKTEVPAASIERESGVPLLMQWDQRWGYLPYGSDVVGLTGCGPLALSMAGFYVTGDEKFYPEKMVRFAAENGYYSKGNGSSWTLISEGGVKLGLDVTEIPLVKKRIFDNLEVGNPIICAMGKGDFTTSGHYIVMVGEEDGRIRVNDPNSYVNSDTLWDYERLEGQIRNLWVIRAGG